MKRARSIISLGFAALTVALLSLGCASSSSGTHHAKAHAQACTQCTVKVVDEVPLPVSTDVAVARLDESWTILEHSCECCDSQGARFFAGAGFHDVCAVDAETGLCCVSQSDRTSPALVQLSR